MAALKFLGNICRSTESTIEKRKGKRSDAVVWQTTLNDRQWTREITQICYKTFDYTTIKDRLILGRSVGTTTVIQSVWLTKGLRVQPSHFPQPPCNQRDKHSPCYGLAVHEAHGGPLYDLETQVGAIHTETKKKLSYNIQSWPAKVDTLRIIFIIIWTTPVTKLWKITYWKCCLESLHFTVTRKLTNITLGMTHVK